MKDQEPKDRNYRSDLVIKKNNIYEQLFFLLLLFLTGRIKMKMLY